MEKRYTEKQIDPKKYSLLDNETGEIEKFKGRVKELIPTHQVSVNYKSYFLLDTDRMQKLISNGISTVELGLIISISSNLHPTYNICQQNDGTPHDTKSISKIINQTVQATKKKLNKLEELGVMARAIIPGMKHLGKVYIVNPHFIKRGRSQGEFLDKLFNDIIKDEPKHTEELQKMQEQFQSISK